MSCMATRWRAPWLKRRVDIGALFPEPYYSLGTHISHTVPRPIMKHVLQPVTLVQK